MPADFGEPCSCSTCQSYCRHKPGWFKQEEIAPLAKFLGLTEQEAFDQFLGVDYWEAYPENIYLISPAVTHMDPGKVFEYDPTGICVFYSEGKCKIHEVKPYECRAVRHDSKANVHKEVGLSWEPHQQYVENLLGEKPCAVEDFD